MKQLKLFDMPTSTAFGGDLLRGKRKSKRPLSTRHAIKVVLRADVCSCGSFRATPRLIQKVINKWAVRFGVKIYEISINSNHLHLLIKLSSSEDFGRFARAVCSQLTEFLGVKWLTRPWTRIVAWGKAFKIARAYIVQNQREAEGEIAYKPRKPIPKKKE